MRPSILISTLVPSVLVSFGCSGVPSTEDVERELRAEYGGVVRVQDVERINGVEYPAGGSMPERYEVEYGATLVPKGPVTFAVSSGLERAVEQGALIKGVAEGHQQDARGLEVFLNMGTELWRTDESFPAKITGVITFTKTENGWRRSAMRSYLAEAADAAASLSKASGEPGTEKKSMLSDLRNLASQQEVYYSNPANNYTYASHLTNLPNFATSHGVEISITAAGRTGWAGVARHENLPGTACGIFFGTVPQGSAGPASTPWQPSCTGRKTRWKRRLTLG
ncbi:MAG: hypothetical protein ACT4O1_00515 [Gemmatimonadota bacterium]